MSQSPPSAPASVASLLASLVRPPGAAASSTPGSTPPNTATPAANTASGGGSAAAASLVTNTSVLGAGASAPRPGMSPLRVVRRPPASAVFANDMHPVLQRIYASRG